MVEPLGSGHQLQNVKWFFLKNDYNSLANG